MPLKQGSIQKVPQTQSIFKLTQYFDAEYLING